MSVDTPPEPDRSAETPVLRREALLPNERSRGLGTVAVVCTMAGVASGLALATTLMAMQVADSMTVRSCPYRVAADVQMDVRPDRGFLGVEYVFRDGVAEVIKVWPGTPAEAINLHAGDHVLAIDGVSIRSATDLQERIGNSRPGTQPSLVVERDGAVLDSLHPTLIAWPALSY